MESGAGIGLILLIILAGGALVALRYIVRAALRVGNLATVLSSLLKKADMEDTDLLIDSCRRAGFEPDVRRNPIQGTPPTTAVQGTNHVAFVTAAAPSIPGARW